MHVAPGSHSKALMQSLVITATVSITLILVFTCVGVYRVYSNHITSTNEQYAIGVASALLDHEMDTLVKREGQQYKITIAGSEMADIDVRMRKFLSSFHIVKIKVYDIDKTIVYSTDKKIIGESDSQNHRLARALLGVPDSHLETNKKLQDLYDESMMNVDVVETYVPIRDVNGDVIGSFEIYMDATKMHDELDTAVQATAVILSAILLTVFGGSFIVLRKSANRLDQAQAELSRIATTDSLTGLWNRRQILSRAEEEFAHLMRRRQQGEDARITFIMIDIDNFKLINDQYGHPGGDIVLRDVAIRIVGMLRDYDLIGRYGGEEFLVVIRDTDEQEAVLTAERLRAAVREVPITVEGVEVSVTISLGVSPLESQDVGIVAPLKRADDALYRAKRAGRDRVVTF